MLEGGGAPLELLKALETYVESHCVPALNSPDELSFYILNVTSKYTSMTASCKSMLQVNSCYFEGKHDYCQASVGGKGGGIYSSLN